MNEATRLYDAADRQGNEDQKRTQQRTPVARFHALRRRRNQGDARNDVVHRAEERETDYAVKRKNFDSVSEHTQTCAVWTTQSADPENSAHGKRHE